MATINPTPQIAVDERYFQSIENDSPTLILPQEAVRIEDSGTTPVPSSVPFDCFIRLKLQANNIDFIFEVKPGEKLTIGRELFGNSLSVHAAQLGVSRQHVVIVNEGKMLTVMDLNSTNGTRLNQLPLIPNQKRLLRYGDTLQLGNLVVKVQCSSSEW